MLLTKPLLRCPGGVFGIIVMLKDPATFHLQCPCWWKVFTQNLTIHGPIHSFLYTDQSSWSLCRKTAPKHDVSTPMLHSRYGVLWMQLSILSPPNTTSWVFTKKLYFGFIWLYDILPILFWIIQMFSSKLQTGLDMYWGTRLALQDLSPWRRSVLLMVAFVTLVPALCRSFTWSPRVVLGFLLTVLVIILTPRGEILRGCPRSREIISGLVCLPFSNNCSHSWFLHTKLLTCCRFSLPSLVQVYNFVSGVLWQLFGLGHILVRVRVKTGKIVSHGESVRVGSSGPEWLSRWLSGTRRVLSWLAF